MDPLLILLRLLHVGLGALWVGMAVFTTVFMTPAIQDAGDPARSDAFVRRWSGWDEALHGRVAAALREQQRYRYRQFTYAALGE